MEKILKLTLLCVACCVFCTSWGQNKSRTFNLARKHEIHLGLYVDSNGVLMRQGKPYRGIGVNYYDAFYRSLLAGKNDTSYMAGFRYLKKMGIPFVRFSCGGFSPADWKLYQINKPKYFALLDDLVKNAERSGIGLIPSMFWRDKTIPELVGEPLNQWGNPNSKTIAFIREYTKEVVSRYANSPAIWGWEFGNEMNLSTDLPKNRPQLSTHDMEVALKEFAKVVRKYDSSRIVISGNNVPRANAYHRYTHQQLVRDSINEYLYMLNLDNPDLINTTNIHLYPQHEFLFFADYNYHATLKDVIRVTMNEAVRMKKPLFLGEFGSPRTLGDEKEHQVFEELLEAIETLKVPLSALWVFDFSSQDKDWNITPDNNRKYQLEEIAEANARMH